MFINEYYTLEDGSLGRWEPFETRHLDGGIQLLLVSSGDWLAPNVSIILSEFTTSKDLREAVPVALNLQREVSQKYWNGLRAVRDRLPRMHGEGDGEYSYSQLARYLNGEAGELIAQHVWTENMLRVELEQYPELLNMPAYQWIDQGYGDLYSNHVMVESCMYLAQAVMYLAAGLGTTSKTVEKAKEYVLEGLANARKAKPINTPGGIKRDEMWPGYKDGPLTKEQLRQTVKDLRRAQNSRGEVQ